VVKTRIYIEAYPISEKHISGIGHMTLELIRALERHPDNSKVFEIVLVINGDRRLSLERWGFRTATIKTIPIPTRLFNIIWKFDLLPPMDIFLGKGVYIFPNYKNWRLSHSRSLTFVCDVSYLLFPQYVSPKNQRFLEKNIHKWIKRTNKVLAISRNAQKELINSLGVNEEKTLLVPCGVDTTMFYKRPEKEIEIVKKEFGITKDYVLYLGNIEPRKNIKRLIEAYKLLPRKQRERYALVLVGGGGWLNESIMKAIRQAQKEGYNVIKPQRYIPEEAIPALHSGAKVLVHVALYEGFGISPLQAMACDTPTIVANNSSLPEVVGEASLLINANDVQDISNNLENLLQDTKLQRKLILEGRKQVKKYTWDRSAQIITQEIRI
jgi:glycosyltransferase involved in cell wall biosynthesis